MNPVLAARGLVKTYGEVRALAGVDVDIHPGDVFLDGNAIGELSETRCSELRRTAFGFVFQSGVLAAEENAALPLLLAGTRAPRLFRPRPTSARQVSPPHT